MRAVYGTEQLDVYTPVEAAAIQSDTSCLLLKSVSLRGNPKESVKHKSNSNGCGSSKNSEVSYYISPFSGEFAKTPGEGSMRMPHFSCNMCCSSTYQQTASTDSGWRS
jgi:hypothetical protein